MRYPEEDIDGWLPLLHLSFGGGGWKRFCQGWTHNAPKWVEIKEPTPTKVNALMGVSNKEVPMAQFTPLPFDPFKWMFVVQDRPWDTYGPALSWSEFLNLRNCLLQDHENWQNQRDELLDQINILQNALIKNNIPIPNLESAGEACPQ